MSNNNNNDNKYTNNSKAKEFITKTITKYTSMLKKTILSILFLLTISSLQSLNLEYKKWKNTNVLWTDAIKKNDNDYYAHHGLAENLAQKCTQNLAFFVFTEKDTWHFCLSAHPLVSVRRDKTNEANSETILSRVNCSRCTTV